MSIKLCIRFPSASRTLVCVSTVSRIWPTSSLGESSTTKILPAPVAVVDSRTSARCLAVPDCGTPRFSREPEWCIRPVILANSSSLLFFERRKHVFCKIAACTVPRVEGFCYQYYCSVHKDRWWESKPLNMDMFPARPTYRQEAYERDTNPCWPYSCAAEDRT